MDQILDQVRDAVEAPIDFQGQKVASILNYTTMTIFGILAFIAGFVTENVYNTVYVAGVGMVITMLAVVPPWPPYNRNPVTWLSPRRFNGAWLEPVAPAKKAI